MKRRMSVLFTLLALLISSLADRAGPSVSEAAPASEQVITLPLFELRIGFKTAFYTTDPNEMAALQGQPKWSYTGIVGYVIPNSKQIPGSVAMYRLTKQVTQHMPTPIPNHTYSNFLFTTDKNEADNAANNLGWRLEGIAFYVSPKPALGSVELYRLYLPYDGDTGLGDVHLYTASKSEMESEVKAGWTFVRVEAYVWTEHVTLDSLIGLTKHTPIINTGKTASNPDTVLLNLDCTRKAAGEYNCNTQRGYETCQSYQKGAAVKACFTTVNPRVQEAMDKLLFTVGCNRFIGRADEFTCKTKKGLDLCDTYRKNGKLKKCMESK
jgi:uncharacterized protein DUF5648